MLRGLTRNAGFVDNFLQETDGPAREKVLFIGTQFSNLYTAVDTPARGRVANECMAAYNRPQTAMYASFYASFPQDHPQKIGHYMGFGLTS